MDKSRQQFEAWRSKNKSSTINLFDVWQASRESLINNLEPVAWMWPVYHSENKQLTDDPVVSENIEMYLQSHGSPFKVIPLYRLD
ncbi:hypothetical protein JZM27_17660 [Providencia huaxiensis]|uniref:hypothetical protein n=1 Tax=Providencia huaxiensis TaxID=2027290 RepID=UPI0019D08675|nr:hypothetical protein [Providencia huaxiensis]MBN6363046.1 hypothetical protein [Providencia huaxiensis]